MNQIIENEKIIEREGERGLERERERERERGTETVRQRQREKEMYRSCCLETRQEKARAEDSGVRRVCSCCM